MRLEWMRDMAGNPVLAIDHDGKSYRLRRCQITVDGERYTFSGEPIDDDEVLICDAREG